MDNSKLDQVGLVRAALETASAELGRLEALLADDEPSFYRPISQRDPRWKDEKLGGGSTTIGDYGCLVTCLAMAASVKRATEISPLYVNANLLAINGYTGSNKNLVIWNKVDQALPCLTYHGVVWCRWTPAPLDRINDTLRRGGFVIAQVDFVPGAAVNSHYVLLTREQGEDFYAIADPWTGKAHDYPPAYCRAGWDAQRGIFALAFFE